jgi:hypothetical protein
MKKEKTLKRPTYSDKAIRLAFEFGLVLSEVAKTNNVAMTQEISINAEKIFLNEMKSKGLRKTALNFVPLILASFGTK